MKIQKLLRNPYILFSYLGSKHLLNWMPDRLYLSLLFRARMGRRLKLNNPLSFNEKLQWLKLHDRDPRYTTLVDKHLVKKVVMKTLGPRAIVPTLGVWKDPSRIDFSALPNQFVLKTNHDSGGVVICRDKDTFDTERAVAFLDSRLKRSYFWATREWPYRDVVPVVFAEQYLNDEAPRTNETLGIRGIVDYKFYCFHGEPLFLYLSQGLEDHSTARIVFLSLEWKPLEFARSDYSTFERIPPQPERFDEMVDAARKLAADIPFVRVDLFEHQGDIVFSEMTFHPVAGMTPFVPTSADFEVGALLDLERVRVAS